MHNTRKTPRSMALAVVWAVSTWWMLSAVTPVTPQTVTNDLNLHRDATSQLLSLLCPAPYRSECVVQPLEAHLSTVEWPVPYTGALLQTRSEEPVSVELQVPRALVRALLMEQRTIGGPDTLPVREALPLLLATEDWAQMP